MERHAAVKWVGGFFFFAGFLVLAYQFFIWLKTGNWVPFPLSIFADPQWLASPTSWVGLNSLLRFIFKIPISFGLILIGFMVFFRD